MPDESPDRIWETLLGRQPTDQERQELIRIRDTLNLPKTDPVWILLVALEYFHSLYRQIPEEIRKASEAATTAFQAQAETLQHFILVSVIWLVYMAGHAGWSSPFRFADA